MLIVFETADGCWYFYRYLLFTVYSMCESSMRISLSIRKYREESVKPSSQYDAGTSVTYGA